MSLFAFSFIFTLWSAGTTKSTIRQVLSFLCVTVCVDYHYASLLAGIMWRVFISKSQRILCVSFSSLCKDHLIAWSNFHFLHKSQWITFPTQMCRILHSFFVLVYLHWLIMCLIDSSLSPRNLHLIFVLILSIFAFKWLVLMASLWAAIRRDSISLLKFPFCSHFQVFSLRFRQFLVWNIHIVVFSSHFNFLVIVLL